MIKLINENTDRFMNAVPKAKRKKYGQFFTNVTTALYMASLFDFDITKPQMSLLDAGAGTGILSAAVVQGSSILAIKAISISLAMRQTTLCCLYWMKT